MAAQKCNHVCSKRNELPLNAKLCVRFLFSIHAEYSKVSSFFFCADSDRDRCSEGREIRLTNDRAQWCLADNAI